MGQDAWVAAAVTPQHCSKANRRQQTFLPLTPTSSSAFLRKRLAMWSEEERPGLKKDGDAQLNRVFPELRGAQRAASFACPVIEYPDTR